MCNQHSISKPHLVSVMQYTVYFCRLVVGAIVSAVLKISLAAGLHNIHIPIHHVVLRAGQFFHKHTACTVVPVRMADEKNLCVAEVEPELLNALANHGHRGLKTTVDENIPLRSGDQVRSQPLASHVVDVAGHMMRREGSSPVRMGLSCQAHRKKHRSHEDQTEVLQ